MSAPVTLAGTVYAVKLPESFSAQQDLVSALARWKSAPHRVCGAMIGACVPGRVRVSLADCAYDVLAFGGAAADELVVGGVTQAELLDAGVAIGAQLMASMKSISAEAVDSAADFSEPSEGGPISA